MNERDKAMNQLEAIKAAIAVLKEAFPVGRVHLHIGESQHDVHYFNTKTYQQGTEWLRSMGCGVRQKVPMDTYTRLVGQVDNITFYTYPDELPPTCRKVRKIERVPKTQTVETGEFIEIEREVIECGPDHEQEANLPLAPKEAV